MIARSARTARHSERLIDWRALLDAGFDGDHFSRRKETPLTPRLRRGQRQSGDAMHHGRGANDAARLTAICGGLRNHHPKRVRFRL